jgi:hypothetical protein
MFEPTNDGLSGDEDPPVQYLEPYKYPPDKLHPDAKFTNASVLAQDHMAWETQGPIADRTTEHLSYSDRGIALFRKLTFEQIQRVKDNLDPMGVIRDPNHPMIDTNIDESTRVEGVDRPVAISGR